MEEWRDIPNFVNYQISNLGNIRRYKYSGGFTKNLKYNLYKSSNVCCVVLCNCLGRKQVTIHNIMRDVFMEGKKEGMVVKHKDGNPYNCKLDNLYYEHMDNIKLSGHRGKRKKIYVNKNGVIKEFPSMVKASEFLNFSNSKLRLIITGRYENNTDFKFSTDREIWI